MALWQADAICDARQAATLTVKIVRAPGKSAPRQLTSGAHLYPAPHELPINHD